MIVDQSRVIVPEEPKPGVYTETSYRSERIVVLDHEWTVFIDGRLTVNDAIELLIAHYKP